jgi:hypothetical protein
MKIDPGMHIGLHLVFFGKTGVTIPKNLMELFLKLTLKRPMIRLSGHSSSRLYA